MEWNRSETLALSAAKCTLCNGIGVRVRINGEEVPCNCVFRAIFRACFDRFVQCSNKDLDESRVSLECGATRDPGGNWSRKNEEFVADFLLLMKRALTESEQRLFRYHYLLGADWRLCTRKLGVEKGVFFHTVYRIQHKLGRTFAEVEPYPLYPVREYFATGLRDRTSARVVPIRREHRTLTDMVPLKRSA